MYAAPRANARGFRFEVNVKVADLFKPYIDPALPPVPSSCPPCTHDMAREVMAEWVKAGRVFTSSELVDELCRRFDRLRGTYPPPPPLVD